MSGVKVGGGPVLAADALIVKDENAYPIVGNPSQGTKHRLCLRPGKALLRKYCRGWADNKSFAPIQWFSSSRLSPFLLRHSVDSNERQ